LSFPLKLIGTGFLYSSSGNQLNVALAYFDAADGDAINPKFIMIYDPIIGWNGTLNYLES
jgi:hypothetical protein